MMDPKLFIHVGVAKTGTTTLQENLFARHSEIHCIGRPHHRTKQYAAFLHAVTRCEQPQRACAIAADFFESAMAGARAKGRRAVVLSDEKLSLAPLNCVVAERLHEAAPSAQILISIRNQCDAIQSLYSGGHYLLKDVPAPWNSRAVSFDNWFAWAFERSPYLEPLHYSRLLEIYESAFERVHVIVFEQMTHQSSVFADELSLQLGINPEEAVHLIAARPKNVSTTQSEIAYLRLRSTFLPNTSLASLLPFAGAARNYFRGMLARSPATKVALSTEQRQKISDRYGPGNVALAAKTGIDLRSLGYPGFD